MKKITLFISLSVLSLVGYAQQSNEITLNGQDQERQPDYIIVLDDTKVEGNINSLLTGDQIHENENLNASMHELAHSEPENFNLEGKLVEGAFSYNDYAIHYKPEIQVSLATS